MALRGINHVVLKVRDLERADAFYRTLGFTPAGCRPGMRFYGGGAHAHDLALYALGPDAPAPPPEATGLLHFCVTVEHEAELGELAGRLRTAGYPVRGAVDHVVSRSFYAQDPDGNVVEVTWDVPQQDWAHLDNPFRTDRPYRLPGAP